MDFPCMLAHTRNMCCCSLCVFWIWHFLAYHVLIGLLSLYSPIKYFFLSFVHGLFVSLPSCRCCWLCGRAYSGAPVLPYLCSHTLWMCLCRCMFGHASADASVQKFLCRCTCLDLHLWVQPCGHASAGELCGHACSGAFKMPLQMNLCRHASAGNLCGCAYGGTCLDMSWQVPLQRSLWQCAFAGTPVWSCLFTFIYAGVSCFFFTCLEVDSLIGQDGCHWPSPSEAVTGH